MRYSETNFGILRVQFTVINGERKSEEFIEHLKASAEIVRNIIATGTVR
jgi:hypothetical protein